jgi:hypothetical protein
MKFCSLFGKIPSLYFFIGILIFSSCTTIYKEGTYPSLQASLEDAKFRENGPSKIRYNPKTGVNVLVTAEEGVLGVPVRGAMFAVPIDAYSETYDTITRPNGTDNNGSLGIKFGIGYVGKGAKAGDVTFSMDDIEVPIDLVYHYPLGPGNIHGGLGPFFAYGVGGSVAGESLYGANNGGFKRFDAGINFMAGYMLKNGLFLDLGYDLGLANIEYATNDVKGYSRSFSINFGYMFGGLFRK